MLKHCSLYRRRRAVSYAPNADVQRQGGSHAPASAAATGAWAVPAGAASPQPTPPPPSTDCKAAMRYENQRSETRRTESQGWGGGITKTKIKERLLARVCQPSQLKEREENKAWQEGRKLFFPFPYRACSFPAFWPLRILHPWQVRSNWNTAFTERFRHINILTTDMA